MGFTSKRLWYCKWFSTFLGLLLFLVKHGSEVHGVEWKDLQLTPKILRQISPSDPIHDPIWKGMVLGEIRFSRKGDRRTLLEKREFPSPPSAIRGEDLLDGVQWLNWQEFQKRAKDRKPNSTEVQLKSSYQSYLSDLFFERLGIVVQSRILENELAKLKFPAKVKGHLRAPHPLDETPCPSVEWLSEDLSKRESENRQFKQIFRGHVALLCSGEEKITFEKSGCPQRPRWSMCPKEVLSSPPLRATQALLAELLSWDGMDFISFEQKRQFEGRTKDLFEKVLLDSEAGYLELNHGAVLHVLGVLHREKKLTFSPSDGDEVLFLEHVASRVLKKEKIIRSRELKDAVEALIQNSVRTQVRRDFMKIRVREVQQKYQWPLQDQEEWALEPQSPWRWALYQRTKNELLRLEEPIYEYHYIRMSGPQMPIFREALRVEFQRGYDAVKRKLEAKRKALVGKIQEDYQRFYVNLLQHTSENLPLEAFRRLQKRYASLIHESQLQVHYERKKRKLALSTQTTSSPSKAMDQEGAFEHAFRVAAPELTANHPWSYADEDGVFHVVVMLSRKEYYPISHVKTKELAQRVLAHRTRMFLTREVIHEFYRKNPLIFRIDPSLDSGWPSFDTEHLARRWSEYFIREVPISTLGALMSRKRSKGRSSTSIGSPEGLRSVLSFQPSAYFFNEVVGGAW